ncbi:MAG: flagellar hook-basal body complex protein [Planctomycetota bacterium]|nr:flagellar hook-basal body complex protein [Planctomycetota bacterium]
MIRSLFTSASGLRGHQTQLDVVGNNLANVNTHGFKSQRLRFSTIFSETLKAASGPQDTLGGRNPSQVGHGVKVAAIDTMLQQGTLEQSDNALDVAIQNAGYFVLDNGRETVFTRAGAFSVDAGNILVDSATGARVQRVGDVGALPTDTAPIFQTEGQNIVIPFGETIAGRETTNVVFQGNLDSSGAGPLAEVLTTGQPFTVGGVSASTANQLNQLDQTTSPYAAGDQVLIKGTTATGTLVDAVFTLTTGAETVADLLAVINAAFGGGDPTLAVPIPPSANGATATMDGNGNIVLTAARQGESQLTINLTSNPANPGGGSTNFNSFTQTTDGREGETASTAITVYDTQGAAHTMSFTFQKVAANEWDLISAIDDTGTFVTFDNGVDGITFNENGSFRGITGASGQEVLSTSLPLSVTATGTSTVAATTATTLNSLDQTGTAYTTGDIRIRGTLINGTTVDTTFLAETGGNVTAATTVNDLLGAVNSAFNSGTTNGATATLVNGNLVLSANTAGPAELSLTLTSVPGDGNTVFEAFTTTSQGADGDSNVTFEINNLASFGTPQTSVLTIGMANAFDGLTQFGGFESVAAVEQNGFAPGTLVDVAVDGDGVIRGIFDNGRTEALAQMAISTFRNAAGLTRLPNNTYRENPNSGVARIGTAQVGGAGTIVGNTLETSNVDIGVEFTRLITAQRGFQVNARAFVTSDEVLEETANLKR